MVGYPNQKRSYERPRQSQSGRGMKFEEAINETNDYYRTHDIAVVHKKPIPIQIVQVDYPSRSGAVIKEAYYQIPSTTDYNGIYQGRYLDFEAKETQNKTNFPLKNIHTHQIEHLLSIERHGGIAFVLIHFKSIGEILLLEASRLGEFHQRALNGGRKSIHIDELRQVGYVIAEGYAPRIPYLKVVDHLIDRASNAE
jgi:recombination protein U